MLMKINEWNEWKQKMRNVVEKSTLKRFKDMQTMVNKHFKLKNKYSFVGKTNKILVKLQNLLFFNLRFLFN